MTRGAAWGAVVGLFLAGIAIGVLATLLVAGPERWPGAARRPGGPGGGPRAGAAGPPSGTMAPDQLARRLELSDEQRELVESILFDAGAESEALRSELRPRLEALMQQTDDRIRDVLDVEQRAEFERLRRRHRSMMDRFLVGPHGGRRRPPRRPPPDGPAPGHEP